MKTQSLLKMNSLLGSFKNSTLKPKDSEMSASTPIASLIAQPLVDVPGLAAVKIDVS